MNSLTLLKQCPLKKLFRASRHILLSWLVLYSALVSATITRFVISMDCDIFSLILFHSYVWMKCPVPLTFQMQMGFKQTIARPETRGRFCYLSECNANVSRCDRRCSLSYCSSPCKFDNNARFAGTLSFSSSLCAYGLWQLKLQTSIFTDGLYVGSQLG